MEMTEEKTTHLINEVSPVRMTNGVKQFTETTKANWFLHLLVTQPEIKQLAESFSVVLLEVHNDKTATITVGSGDTYTSIVKRIGYTDCPTGTWKFYYFDNTIMLSSEYHHGETTPLVT